MFNENLSQFIKDFGIDVVFQHSTNSPFTVRAIMDSPPFEQDVYDRSFYDKKFYEARLSSAKVQLYAILSEVSSLVTNDKATIGSATWYVIGFDPDGTGMAIVYLSVNKV